MARKKNIERKPHLKSDGIKVLISTQNDDDWMRSLPEYAEEGIIHEQLAEEHKRKLAAGEVDIYGTPVKKVGVEK